MNLTEKEMILNWAQDQFSEERRSEIFGEANNQESYYVERLNKHCIEEYGFDTVVELKKLLGELWDENEVMKEIILPVVGSCFKQHVDNAARNPAKESEYKELPEFVYVF